MDFFGRLARRRLRPLATVSVPIHTMIRLAIRSMATSSYADAPRGMEFLYSANRFNVAISRAKCLAILVASPEIFDAECKTPRQMQLKCFLSIHGGAVCEAPRPARHRCLAAFFCVRTRETRRKFNQRPLRQLFRRTPIRRHANSGKQCIVRPVLRFVMCSQPRTMVSPLREEPKTAVPGFI
jgi:hypothetical protein